MRPTRDFELPEDRRPALARAKILAWGSIAYLLSTAGLLALVMGGSQAMKTEMFEALLSVVPPIAFLVSVRVQDREPSVRYPYGYHRVVSIAFLVAALTLLTMGLYLLFEALSKLARAEHPTIGSMELFGSTIWAGWLMIPPLAYSIVPPIFLGRAKMEPARRLHDKTLKADATMNKADWMSGTAALVGVIGIAFGFWWADAVAAAVISLDILHDGFTNVREVITDLMDREPQTIAQGYRDGLPARVAAELRRLDWVEDAEVRLREHGHVFFGEAFVVPKDRVAGDVLTDRIAKAVRMAEGLDWRLHDLVIQPVRSLDEPGPTGTQPGDHGS